MLLHHPGHEFHATELVGGATVDRAKAAVATHGDAAGGVRISLDDGDTNAPDTRAAARYRRRLAELDEELGEAERHHDLGRLDRLHAEQHAIRSELVTAARGRRSGTHAERARLTVTKGIGTVLARIVVAHPTLGAHLSATVHRGYFCAYAPDPRHPITWDR
jgi:non-specific serine/threonine protein kinase